MGAQFTERGVLILPRASKNSRLAPPEKPPRGSAPSSRLLSQARLDRISRPTLIYFQTWVHWFLKMQGDQETYTTARLREKAYALGSETALLLRQVREPEETLPAPAWEKLEDELQRSWGMTRAIEEALRQRGTGGRTGTSRPPPFPAGGGGSKPAPPASASTEGPDPFSEE